MADFDTTDFDAIKISLASADTIRGWARGEVKKPETINYRTQKPEKDGLFCEKIFGPVKDWECSCGKYKGIRYKGITCEHCGVEVTTAKVRRERMGYIELATPVSHIWFFKSPSTIPLSRILDIKKADLEKVLYFASYVITHVDYEAREEDAELLKEELAAEIEQLDAECNDEIERLRARGEGGSEVFGDVEPLSEEEIRAGIVDLEEEFDEEKRLAQEAFEMFMQLSEGDLVNDESLFSEMRRHYSIYFRGGMGAEAVRDLLRGIDLERVATELRGIISNEEAQKNARTTATKRLKIIEDFLKSGNDPSNMILDVIPVIPPDLRPMVQLDGGRFAASDLNDLYRRVINRNNRLKRLLDLDAPAIIVNNEKRMLQESVDALFDNGRRGRPVTGRGNRALKSLAEALKGKQGRFRQNLLGKRVDYSGRSVIVVDPRLKLHQCGLPSEMALELFKPFVMRRLVEKGKVENIKGARRAIDRMAPVVWDILDEVIKNRLVLLNRAPTLHRLSIQAFEPVLVEGKAIHLHPLVCAPFNADFDGDQMSVHVPLSTQAQTEARVLMLSSNNLRKPASGEVVTVPSQDMVFGVYYLTRAADPTEGRLPIFASFQDALDSYAMRTDLDIQSPVMVRVSADDANLEEDGRLIFRMRGMVKRTVGDREIESIGYEDIDVTDGPARIETTIGRIIFNTRCLPSDYPYMNYKINGREMKRLVNDCCDRYSVSVVEETLDAIKAEGFHYATRGGLTISVWDAVTPEERPAIIAEAQRRVDEINASYEDGVLTEADRHNEVVEVWNKCSDEVGRLMSKGFAEDNPIYMMADSGARGNQTQMRQLAGMRGLMADMSGETIDLPIKASFRDGLKPLEYFISTYGARKGLVDTASHTSDSGYLTRRLVDVAQDVIVREEDCGTDEGVTYPLVKEGERPGDGQLDGDLIGRCLLHDVVDPTTGEILLERDGYIESMDDLVRLQDAGIDEVEVRALLTCKSKYGVCQKCYGWDLSTRRPVNIGVAVGIIAAQSIGEPGTQLTMRTIHSGGVAGADDITQGLPAVSRMFDVVSNVNKKIVGREARIAEMSGILHFEQEDEGQPIRAQILSADDTTRILVDDIEIGASHFLTPRFLVAFESGEDIEVHAGDQITSGFVNFSTLRSLTDIESTMHTFVASVKRVYTSQGVELNDKHIEVIARQMLRRVEVTNPGDSTYLLGEYVDRFIFADTVRNITLAGGTPPEAIPVILGTHKVAGAIDSWLSAASFVRTAGVLTEVAIKGEVDHLLDLKSNVIVGKKIPAGTGLKPYNDVRLTYHGTPIEGSTSPLSKTLPDSAPESLKEIEERMPKQLDWVGDDFGLGGMYSKNGRTLSSDDASLYLCDDLNVSQRWTNKFGEVGIETVGDLIGKTEDDLLRIDGIGAKAIEELREGLAARNLLYILEPDEDEADGEDLSQLLNMVFSPDPDSDIMLGTAAPAKHTFDDDLIGGESMEQGDDIVNEDLDSLQDLLSQVDRDDDDE